jgi:hypothetical protein
MATPRRCSAGSRRGSCSISNTIPRASRSTLGPSERCTLVEITAFPGRSVEAKRALYAANVRNLEAIGTPANDVLIVLHQPAMQDRGIRGGHSADEVELSYPLDV